MISPDFDEISGNVSEVILREPTPVVSFCKILPTLIESTIGSKYTRVAVLFATRYLPFEFVRIISSILYCAKLGT